MLRRLLAVGIVVLAASAAWTMPVRINESIPLPSADGLFHARFPQGNAPTVHLQGAANDATTAAATLAGSSFGAGSILIDFPSAITLTAGQPFTFTMSAVGGSGTYVASSSSGGIGSAVIDGNNIVWSGTAPTVGEFTETLGIEDSTSPTATTGQLVITCTVIAN